MYQYFTLFNISIPVYSFFSLLGMAASILLMTFKLRKKMLLNKYLPTIPVALIGLIIGAKIFAILSFILSDLYTYGTIDFKSAILHSGIVYFGGLYGLLISFRISCLRVNRNFDEISDILGLAIPLFHTFGRIGCFFAGCCYGCPWSGILGINYRIEPGGEFVRRFPTQLLESFLEFSVFIVMIIVDKKYKNKEHKSILTKYLIAYSLFRFFIEFFRGDMIRGVFGIISFSQIICIITIACLIANNILTKKKETNQK